jgi:hypothetical protein
MIVSTARGAGLPWKGELPGDWKALKPTTPWGERRLRRAALSLTAPHPTHVSGNGIAMWNCGW